MTALASKDATNLCFIAPHLSTLICTRVELVARVPGGDRASCPNVIVVFRSAHPIDLGVAPYVNETERRITPAGLLGSKRGGVKREDVRWEGVKRPHQPFLDALAPSLEDNTDIIERRFGDLKHRLASNERHGHRFRRLLVRFGRELVM